MTIENPRSNILAVQKHLDSAGVAYLNSINGTTPESLIGTMKKLSPFARYIAYPETIVSVGIGQGEEIEALHELFGRNGTSLIGIDLSTVAIDSSVNRTEKNNIPFSPAMASATNLPLKENSVNGVSLSSVLHEVYSYLPDGMEAWQQTILEATRILAKNGILFLRDPAAPNEKVDVEVEFLSDLAQDFYRYFRQEFRVFRYWDETASIINSRREPDQTDYPPLNTSGSIVLPLTKVAELMLHFRNFWNDLHKGLVELGDPKWKEMSECYLLPNPHSVGDVLSLDDYVQRVLLSMNSSVGEALKMICLQSTMVMSPETNEFLARHFSLRKSHLQPHHAGAASLALIDQTTRKMELVFKKVDNRI